MAAVNQTATPWWTYGYNGNDTNSPDVISFMAGNTSTQTPFSRNRPRLSMEPDSLRFVMQNMRLFYMPLVIAFGLVGNTLTCLILLLSRLRSLSSSHYLAAIVVVNTFYLVSLLIHWLLLFNVDLYHRPGWCQFVNFFNSACSFLSVWYMTAFCVDRYICICWSAEASKMCTRMRARIVIICLLCMSIVVFMNTSLTVGVIVIPTSGKEKCTQLPMFKWDLFVLDLIDMFVNLGLPYTTVLVLLSLIICKAYKARRHGVHTENPSQICSVTITFLLTCLLFHLPIEVFRVVHTARRLLDKDYPRKVTPVILLTQRVLQDLFHTSLAGHFILFLVCYPMFRETCKTPFNWIRGKMLLKFRKAPNGDINLRNVRFHAVQDEANAAHV